MMNRRLPLRSLLFCLLFILTAAPDASAQRREGRGNRGIRPVPPAGVEVPADQAAALRTQLSHLATAITELNSQAENNPRIAALLPDVMIYHRAVREALDLNEFFRQREITGAANLIAEGLERAAALQQGEAPWTTQKGLVVRGYISKIDNTPQPYGLVIPDSYDFNSPQPHRVDIWFHGRNENITENAFILQRRSWPGEYTPDNTIVIHPFGRYSNAFKFAGETDVYEALDSVRNNYSVDNERISVRGFSMGGAANWQFAVHDSSAFFAATPGAGFVESKRFLRLSDEQIAQTPWWQQKLWALYDCDLWAINLTQLPTIAYSGENDGQKQAADVMDEALTALGIQLQHIIGPGMGHRLHPDSKQTIDSKLASLAIEGRQQTPDRVRFVTYTLRYNKMNWVTIDSITQHWERSYVDAQINTEPTPDTDLTLTTENITALTLSFAAGQWPRASESQVTLLIDGQRITAPAAVYSDRSMQLSLHRTGYNWNLGPAPTAPDSLTKQHGLQGPIDDALMDSFIFVQPTGTPANTAAGEWATAELDRATREWRRHMRGDARIKPDSAITEEDIANANLILWGDPSSNTILAKIADQLPIQWSANAITVGDRTYDSANHALVMVYPNPLNPSRYIVINSSFTYRERAYLNNAMQVPMLPDWAIVDLSEAPGPVWPGRIAEANFFNEAWQLKPTDAR